MISIKVNARKRAPKPSGLLPFKFSRTKQHAHEVSKDYTKHTERTMDTQMKNCTEKVSGEHSKKLPGKGSPTPTLQNPMTKTIQRKITTQAYTPIQSQKNGQKWNVSYLKWRANNKKPLQGNAPKPIAVCHSQTPTSTAQSIVQKLFWRVFQQIFAECQHTTHCNSPTHKSLVNNTLKLVHYKSTRGHEKIRLSRQGKHLECLKKWRRGKKYRNDCYSSRRISPRAAKHFIYVLLHERKKTTPQTEKTHHNKKLLSDQQKVWSSTSKVADHFD